VEKLDIPATYLKSIPHHQTTPTAEEVDDWHDLPFRPKKDCEACAGAGFLYIQSGTKSRLVPCRAAGCLADSVKQSLRGEAPYQTFDNFKHVRGTEQSLRNARELASGKGEFKWLLIYGSTGNGKTHLCNAITNEMRDRGIDVRLILAGDLFSMLREGIKDNRTEDLLRRLKEVQFLAVDDYGVEYSSDWELAKFDEIMTARYAAGRETVVITNKDISDLPPRIRSRFEDGRMSRFCHNDAPDYRQTRK